MPHEKHDIQSIRIITVHTLTFIIRTGLPILVELIDLVNFVVNTKFQKSIPKNQISNELTQMVNFPRQIPDCDSHSPALFDFFLSSDTSICSTTAFSPLGNRDRVVVSVSIDFPSNSQWGLPFHHIAYDYSCAD